MINTQDNTQILIDKLNLRKVHIKKDEIWACCPKHRDNNPDNFSISLTTGKAFCFSCQWAGNVVTLLNERDLSYDESFLIWNTVKKTLTFNIDLVSEPVNKDLVSNYRNFGVSPYTLTRIINWDVINLYNIYSDNDGNPIFLVNDGENITRAIWVDNLEYRKKSHASYILLEPLTAKTDGWLYGEHLLPREYNIIVEGFYDAPSVYEKLEEKYPGKYNVLAVMGIHITEAQKEKIMKLSNVYFMPDGDEAGRNARDIWHEMFEHKRNVRFCGKYKDDPDMLSVDELIDILENSKNWLDYFFEVKKM